MISQLWVQEWWDLKVFRQQVNLSLRLIWNPPVKTTVEQSLVQVKQGLPWEVAIQLTLLLLKKRKRGNPVPSPIFHTRTRNLSLSMKATNSLLSNNLAWAGKSPLLKICNWFLNWVITLNGVALEQTFLTLVILHTISLLKALKQGIRTGWYLSLISKIREEEWCHHLNFNNRSVFKGQFHRNRHQSTLSNLV